MALLLSTLGVAKVEKGQCFPEGNSAGLSVREDIGNQNPPPPFANIQLQTSATLSCVRSLSHALSRKGSVQKGCGICNTSLRSLPLGGDNFEISTSQKKYTGNARERREELIKSIMLCTSLLKGEEGKVFVHGVAWTWTNKNRGGTSFWDGQRVEQRNWNRN